MIAGRDRDDDRSSTAQRCQLNLHRPRLAQPIGVLSHGRRPSGWGLGVKASKCAPADEVTLGVEGVEDRCVGREHALG